MKYPYYTSLLLGLSQSLPSAAASIATLYATHYSTGSVYSLSLDRATNGSYSLSIASSLKTCGPYPSWVTFDAATRTLYCSDENGGRSTNGSLTALAAPQGDGMLAELARTDAAPGGGVNSVIYEDGRGGKYLAIAHYAGSALSTFSLPISSSSAAAADPLQVFPFQLSSSPGTVPDRQEAPHPHQTLLDPTGAYVLVPDLGADLVRVFAIDKQSGQLTSCPSLPYPPGGGPRHGVFAAGGPVSRVKGHKPPPAAAEGQTILYVAGELNKEVEAFVVSYPLPSDKTATATTTPGCLSFNRIQSLTPYPDPGLPAGASLAEIRLVRDHVYVSVRLDGAFPPDDSVATLNRHRNGTLRLDEITSSYGVMPRTMAVNKAGNLVAVGNQLSSTVAIVPRDVVTGKLGEALAVLQVGVPGQPDTMEGLSSVIWAE
ncbi:hypothetical protein ARAM_006133 [Aspergillus rambellii]|uniref:6-phosphogluconolactonase n=1 Tax=Aspergillus rambellii TaxID=308745 RepID=A0A0F8V434_9EURO|nr:hypothetical protein ARAM_006133 [Aspergillus rambellii]